LPGTGVSVGGAYGLLHDAETSVRKTAIVRVIAEPAYRAVYAAQAAGGARMSVIAQTIDPAPAAAAVTPTKRL